MEKKVIKTESEYSAALAVVEKLMNLDPEPGSPEADELELLALLVGDYESKRFPMLLPDPVSAIQFRMEQQGLSQRDLVPYIGSRSKVSEVLSGKRPLTLSMIRALHSGLGIPARVLLQERPVVRTEEDDIEWERFPLREIISREWISGVLRGARQSAEYLVKEFMAPIGGPRVVVSLCLRRGHVRSARTMDRYALTAWCAGVLIQAAKRPVASYTPGSIDRNFMREVAKLSWSERGPLLAQEFLGKHGISLIIEPHFPRTHLDGASMMTAEVDTPVIGLTLRHDRIDNFWFALMHELSHVAKHLDRTSGSFFDDLDSPSADLQEQEADRIAGEALIPEREWAVSPARNLRSPEAAQHLAERLKIHPAIVAGRMRYESGNFRILNQMVGLGEVRRLFPGVRWK